MKLSMRWLSRYVDLDDQTPEQVRDDLTMSTAEIEDVAVFGGELGDLVVGRVVEHGKHPDADRLSVNKVDVGDGEPLSIVCGASNVAAGQNVVVIKPGGVLPGGHKIKKTKIRGAVSLGMICSERELGLSEEHEGIMVLGDDLRPGAKLVDALPIVDHVLEIENKSINHRPDLWGHFGFARELSAILGRPLRSPKIADDIPSKGQSLGIEIEDRDDCPRFTGVVLTGLRPVASPDWLRWLLASVGQRPIGLAVDVTNFVMLELGQPMHAFDLRFLSESGILVRRATQGERMTTLDGIERQLETSDLVVTSGGQPVALAGIMGGEGSAVADDTTELFLESANFHPTRVRRTSSRLGLRTDASARFEKSLDPAGAEHGSRRFVQLLGELCPGVRPVGPLRDPGGWEYQPRTIALRKARLDLKLGVEIDAGRVREILESLQFGVEPREDGVDVEVPSFRATKDVTIEDDLIEEVGRMFRYDNIPPKPLVSVLSLPHREDALYLARELLRIGATEFGCHEVYNYSFVPDAVLSAVGAGDHEYATVTNPVAPEMARIRRHVMPSTLSCVASNLRARPEVRLMEHGKGYHPETRDSDGLPREVHEVAFVWSRREGEHPYLRLRSHIESLLDRLGFPSDLSELHGRGGLPWVHPGRTVSIVRGGPAVGFVGCLHPAAARELSLPDTTAIANLDIGKLLESGRDARAFERMSRFPTQPVDVALLSDESVHVADVAELLVAAGKKLVRDVELFEVYRGEGLPDGKKSLNFTVTLGAADRTLDSKDEEKYLNKVRDRAAEVGCELRG